MVERHREEPDRREQILGAALRVFAERGFHRATIKEISREAGIKSPALIYWYFPDKETLFREVLESRAPIVRVVADPASVMDLPPEEVLPRLGRAYLAFDQFDVQMLRLMLGEALRSPEVAEMFIKNGPGRVLEFLKGYLELQIEKGRLRPHDVRSSARAFIGMLVPQLAGKLFFPTLAEDGLTDEEHLKAATELLLEGLRAEGDPRG